MRPPASATAPTDPYATALTRLQVFSQVVLDAKATAVALHTVQFVNADGSTSTVLDDLMFVRVNAGLNALAVEGTKLSNLLATRATPAEISTQMAALTGVLSAQLAPSVIGIKNPVAQEKYVAFTSLISLGLNVLANTVAFLSAPQESRYDPTDDPRDRAAPYGAGPRDPDSYHAGPEGSAPVAARRSGGAPRPGQRQFRQGDWLVAVA